MKGYVYIQTEKWLWTVGHYKADGEWVPESDFATQQEAIKRVRYLNGGADTKTHELLDEIQVVLQRIEKHLDKLEATKVAT